MFFILLKSFYCSNSPSWITPKPSVVFSGQRPNITNQTKKSEPPSIVNDIFNKIELIFTDLAKNDFSVKENTQTLEEVSKKLVVFDGEIKTNAAKLRQAIITQNSLYEIISVRLNDTSKVVKITIENYQATIFWSQMVFYFFFILALGLIIYYLILILKNQNKKTVKQDNYLLQTKLND